MIFTTRTKLNQLIATQVAQQTASQVNSNLFKFLGDDLPVIKMDGHDYNHFYNTISAVYAVTDLIMKKFVASPYVFYKIKNETKYKEYKRMLKSDLPGEIVKRAALKAQAVEEVDVPRLSELLDNPNKQQDGILFKSVLALSYLLNGNSYMYMNTPEGGKPAELYAFPEMQIVSGGVLEPVKGYRLFYGTDSEQPFEADQIHHFKTANPQFTVMGAQLYGVSPLHAALKQMQVIDVAHKESARMINNGGPLGLLYAKQDQNSLGTAQQWSLKETLIKAKGVDSRFKDRIIPIDREIGYQQIGLPASDLQMMEQVDLSVKDIYRIYHVPLQYYNQEASTSNNQSAAIRQLIYDCVAPLCDVFGSGLTKSLGKAFGVEIVVDYTQLPEMAVNLKEVMEYIKPMLELGLLSLDEGREALRWGAVGSEEMQAHYMASNRISVRNAFEGNNVTQGNTQP